MGDVEPNTADVPSPSPKSEPLKYEPVNQWTAQGIGIVFGIGVTVIVMYLMRFVPKSALWIFPLLAVVLVGWGLLRKFKGSLLDAQSRLIEWLAAIGFMGLLMALGKELLRRSFAGDNTDLMIVIAVGAFVWSFCGAAWGWHLAKRMKQNDGRKRFGYILKAWLAVPGVVGAIAAPAFMLSCMFAGPGEDVLFALMGGAVSVAMVIPAWRLNKAAPLLTSQRALGGAFKPAIVDTYAPCKFGPVSLNFATVLLNLSGFNLVLLPVLVWRILKQPKSPVTVDDLPLDDFPAPVVEFFHEYHETLREAGFERKHYLRLRGGGKNLVNFMVYYLHREKGQVGFLTTTYILTHTGGHPYRCALDLSSKFGDDRVVITTNSCDLGFPIRNPHRDLMKFPEVMDVALLHRIHDARLKKLGLSMPGLLPEPGQELPELVRGTQKLSDFEYQEIMPLAKTLVGVWSIVWPAGPVRNYRIRKQARAEMLALGLGEPR